jgi:hypothetical protein
LNAALASRALLIALGDREAASHVEPAMLDLAVVV